MDPEIEPVTSNTKCILSKCSSTMLHVLICQWKKIGNFKSLFKMFACHQLMLYIVFSNQF